MLGWLCYALVAAVWALDICTPQLFVAAILLNVPIALSSIAFSRRLTISLTIVAELANIVSGYVNTLQTGDRVDPIAVADRVLLAASFLLVSAMALKTQELGKRAGMMQAEEREAHRERRLRQASEAVHASLNEEFVINAICEQACTMLEAARAVLAFGPENPTHAHHVTRVDGRCALERSGVPAEVRSLLAGVQQAAVLQRDSHDRIASLALETLGFECGICAHVDLHEQRITALALRSAQPWGIEDARVLQRFLETAADALAQARLFTGNVEQKDYITKQNEQLLERSAIIRDIIYALAHDLRTPLAASSLTLNQAMNGAYGALPLSYRSVLRTSIASNAEMQRNVQTLLGIARYESEDWSEFRERVEIGSLLDIVQQELTASAQSKGIDLSVTVAGNCVVQAEPSDLRRACVNLGANAIAATPAGGHVRMQASAEGHTAVIVFEDDGYGVPEEERVALFQRFGVGRRRRGSGTGLGLYLVRLVAERHNGSITYEPRFERGSRFVLRLPAVA